MHFASTRDIEVHGRMRAYILIRLYIVALSAVRVGKLGILPTTERLEGWQRKKKFVNFAK